MRSGEFATIQRLRERFREGRSAGVVLGIGDDAAVLDVAELVSQRGQMVWTIDEQVEGTHFVREHVSWEDVGWRSFVAAASDLAAMGATPWCALTALVLASDLDDEDIDSIARGQQEAALEVGCSIVGGNMSRGTSVSVATTLLGTAPRPVTRSGAEPGDDLWIAGEVGLAAAGLVSLERAVLDERVERAAFAWLRPRACIAEGLAMAAAGAHAAIDVSDGLAQDTGHVAAASGVAAIFEAELLLARARASGLVLACDLMGLDPMTLMLQGGEDYALVVASPVPIPGFWRAGTFAARPPGDDMEPRDVLLRDAGGRERVLAEAHGFDHFKR
jgi:thiamine-monophosphate kinase